MFAKGLEAPYRRVVVDVPSDRVGGGYPERAKVLGAVYHDIATLQICPLSL